MKALASNGAELPPQVLRLGHEWVLRCFSDALLCFNFRTRAEGSYFEGSRRLKCSRGTMYHRIKRLLQVIEKQPLAYIFCRFKIFRDIYAWARRFQIAKTVASESAESQFSSINPVLVAKTIRSDSYALGFNLDARWLSEFLAQLPTLHATDVRSARRFLLSDIKDGKLSDGTSVALAFVDGLEKLDTVKALMNDAKLLASVRNYLGYRAENTKVLLYCSFVGDFSLEDRRRSYQTVEYHYDVHAMNFCYAHFYLTDTDKDSGAHVLIRGSHRAKPLRFLFGSARASDEAVEAHYGKDKVTLIEGVAGTGFLEDTSCFHKALTPIKQNRLMLQIRYGS